MPQQLFRVSYIRVATPTQTAPRLPIRDNTARVARPHSLVDIGLRPHQSHNTADIQQVKHRPWRSHSILHAWQTQQDEQADQTQDGSAQKAVELSMWDQSLDWN